MKHLFAMTAQHRLAVDKNSGWFVTWGILLISLGILAISYANVTTLISIITLGALLAAGGIILVIDSFLFWRKRWSGFFLHLLMGILYFGIGGLLIKGPEVASVSLTLLLAFFYITLGIFRLGFSIFVELPGHWLRMLNGLVTLLLGILILAAWPVSGLFVIGLFIGIDLIFLGLIYLLAVL